MPKKGKPASEIVALREWLISLGDLLQAVSLDSLEERGGWDWTLFEEVLGRVEQITPSFQAALTDYLVLPEDRSGEIVVALLAVDRLSTAYTYWTRLFPPRQADESMFVLSLLHDLSDKVERAIQLLDNNY